MSEKSYQAWKTLEEKIKAKDRQMINDLEASGDKDAFFDLLKKIDQTKMTPEQVLALKTEFSAIMESLVLFAEKCVKLTEYSPMIRLHFMERYTFGLNRLWRDTIPNLFGIDDEDMDKIVRAIEQDRRIDAHRRTLEGMPYEDYLRTDAWKMRREQALRDAGNKCQLCYSPKYLDVHHKTYERRGHELPQDLTVLCRDCHAKFHNKLPE